MGWKAFEAEKPGRSDRKADETSLETAGRRGVKKLLRFFCGFFVIIKIKENQFMKQLGGLGLAALVTLMLLPVAAEAGRAKTLSPDCLIVIDSLKNLEDNS